MIVSISSIHFTDKLIDWFTLNSTDRINLGLMYFFEPDITSHEYGLESDQLRDILKEIDNGLVYLFQKLEQNGLLDSMNVILTADHGFIDTPKSKFIMMDNIVPPEWYQLIFSDTPIFRVMPKDGRL